jgi:hypothetical protein
MAVSWQEGFGGVSLDDAQSGNGSYGAYLITSAPPSPPKKKSIKRKGTELKRIECMNRREL